MMDSAHCGGLDEKIPPVPGTIQIAGVVEFSPLTNWEKDKK